MNMFTRVLFKIVNLRNRTGEGGRRQTLCDQTSLSFKQIFLQKTRKH